LTFAYRSHHAATEVLVVGELTVVVPKALNADAKETSGLGHLPFAATPELFGIDQFARTLGPVSHHDDVDTRALFGPLG
jgi:hypothetical protein